MNFLLAIKLLKHIMIKVFNKFSYICIITGVTHVTQGICCTDGRKYLDVG